MAVKQVADYLQMDEHAIYKLSRSGKIPSFKIAGQWRFKKRSNRQMDKRGIFGENEGK